MSKRALHVLLVEPDEAAYRRLQGFLDREPGVFAVERALELREALVVLARGRTDVVILDLRLPDSEGLEALERMRAFAPEVPVVVVTEAGDEGMAREGMRGGAQDFVPERELTPRLLIRILRHAVERHRLMSALRSLSLIDDLTGLYNHRGFNELGARYLRFARRAGKCVTLIYLDLDRFRNINQSLGHHMGDRALQRVARVLEDAFRNSDLIARVGPDEFAVLAPETSEAPPQFLVRRIRDAVAAYNRDSDDPFQLSVSVGVVRDEGAPEMELGDLVARAGADMNIEKHGRRMVRP
ncbi:MAG: diguanylate cyclase [Longimicrobiales bacterium]|nr:diguanylate cyclase [Longimicrobiales bacterium]